MLTALARDTHGALSILGSTSLKRFGGLDTAIQRVLGPFEIWRSYVVVSRQMANRTDHAEAANIILNRVGGALEGLRDAYAGHVNVFELPAPAMRDLGAKFSSLYSDLQNELDEFGGLLGLRLSFPSQFNSLRRVCFERSLRWLMDELEGRCK